MHRKIKTAKSLWYSLAICAGLLSAGKASAATVYTWTNSAGDFNLDTAINWNPNGTPQSNAGDTMQWDGSAAGDLTVTIGRQNAGNPGLNLNATSGQTGSVTINSAGGGGSSGGWGIGMNNNYTMASGAGPVTIGDGVNPLYFRFGNANTHYLTNNSTSPFTFGPMAYYVCAGGAAQTLIVSGSGPVVFNSPLQQFGGSQIVNLTMNGSGPVTLNGTNYFDSWFIPGNPGTVTVNSGKLILGGDNALPVNTTLNMAGGSLDSSVPNLVLANSNPQKWSSFTFVGSQNLDLGYGNVALQVFNSTVTVNANTLTVGGVISGAHTLVKAGPGTLVLNNANLNSSGNTINDGVLRMGSDSAVPLGGPVTVNSPGTLDLNGFSPTLANLTGSGTIDTVVGGAPILTVSSSANSTFSGVIKNSAGTLALTKTGNSTLTLSGANTYTGNTTVSTGTLLVDGSTASASAVTVASGATLGGTNTIGGTVDWQSGSAALFTVTDVAGANATPLHVSGSVTLNNNDVTVNVPGVMPLMPGTYTLMTYNNTGSSGQFVTSITSANFTGAGVQAGTASTISTTGGTVTLTVVATGVSATWITDGSGNWSAGANWSSNPNVPKDAGDGATLGVGSAFTSVTLDLPVSLGLLGFTNANSFLIADSGNTLTFDNAGAGAVVSVTAGSSNSIGSTVALNDNVAISPASGTSLALINTVGNGSSGARTLTINGAANAAVELSSANTYGPSAGSVGTTVNGGPTAMLKLGNATGLGAGDVNFAGSTTIQPLSPMTLANNFVTIPGYAQVGFDTLNNTVTLSGVVSGPGALMKYSAGTLVLNNANTFAGTTTVDAGTLRLGHVAGIPGGAGYGNVTVNTNGTLDLNGLSPTLNGLNGAGIVDSLAGGAVTLTLGENGAWATFNGSIENSTGALTLVKNGDGTQTLGGNNSYTGGTTINAGTLQIGSGGTAGSAGTGDVVDNANLSFNLTGANNFANTISGSGAVTLANSTMILDLSGNNTFAGDVNVNAGVLRITDGSALGTGVKNVNSTTRDSKIWLDGAAGDVNLGSDLTWYLSNDTGAVFNKAGSNTLAGSIFMPYGGGNPVVNVDAGFLTLAGPISTVAGQASRTIILGGAGDGRVSGIIGEAGPATSVAKQDAGTWTLSADNTYNGTTTVNGGTLLINGYNYGVGAVTVLNNATLGGIGTLFSAATWQAGAKGAFTVTPSGGVNVTPMTVYGNVVLNGNSLSIYVAGGTPLPPGNYVLLYEGSPGFYNISGSFAATPTFTGAGIAAGTTATVVSSSSAVTLTVVNNSTWVNDGNGNWTTGANWDSNPSYPNAAGRTATLGVGSALTTINLDGNETVGGLFFTNANSFVITNAANVLTLDNSGGGAIISVNAGASNSIATGVALNDATTISSSAGTALSIPGSIGGYGPLTFGGNGVLALSGANTCAGGITLNGGTNGATLVLGSTNALGSGTLTIAAGNLDSSVPDLANLGDNLQTWDGSFTFVGSQNLNLGAGDIMMNAASTVTVVTNTLTVGGTLSGSQTLTKAGAGTLVLGGANGSYFSGNVTLSDGTVAIGDDTSLGFGTVEFKTGTAAIRSSDSTARTVVNNITMSYGGIYEGTGNLTFSGTLASGNYGKTNVVNNPRTTFSGTLMDGGNVQQRYNVKAGPGTLVLSGDNSAFNKGFTVIDGTLALGSATALGINGTNMLILNGGNLDSIVPGLVMSGDNPQTWNTNFAFAGTENLDLGTGSVTLNGDCTIAANAKVLTVGGPISGAAFSLTKAGAGKLILSGANTYSNTTVNAGTLEIAQATLATNSSVTVAGGATLQLDFATTNTVSRLVLDGVAQTNGVYGSSTPGGYLAGTGYLRVIALGPTGPAQLTNSVSGSTLSLAWPDGQGWRLQMQTNSLSTGLGTNWIYVTDGSISSTNIITDPSKPTVFYRLVYP